MATNIDKALYEAPQGLDQLGEAEEPIEIEIEDPEAVRIKAGDVEIEIEPTEDDDEFSKNLAEDIPDDVLAALATELIGDYESDVSARKDWVQTYVDGLELLGLKIEERTEPWPGACGVYHPLLTEAVVKFQAETMMETFPAAGPVKTKIIGKETPEKKDAAERVQEDMNYQLTDVMKEYRPEHERMLWGLGLAGNAFKKVYYDPSLGRQVSMYAPAEDVVVPYGASSLADAERITHVMRKNKNDLKRLQHEGFYRDIDLGEPTQTMDEVEKRIAEKMGFRATQDDRFKLLEMQVDLDLKGYEHKDEDTAKKRGLRSHTSSRLKRVQRTSLRSAATGNQTTNSARNARTSFTTVTFPGLVFIILALSILLVLLLNLVLLFFVSWWTLELYLIYPGDLKLEDYVPKATTPRSPRASSVM